MDNEKIQSLISQLRGVGLGDEEILDVFYAAFQKGKMDRKDLETLADSLGYELDDDFKEDKTPDPIEGGEGEKPEITKEAAEDLKEIKPGESKEEFKEKVDEAKDEIEADADDKKEEAHEDKEEEDEDKEWDEANKYFKI